MTEEKVTPPVPPSPSANPDFVSWKYPPYCELCSVYFPGEVCSETHFRGDSHRNRLKIWEKCLIGAKQPTEPKSKNVICQVCWSEMNTQAIFDRHCQSPAHKKKEKDRLIVQKLKEEYQRLKEEQCDSNS